MASQTRRALGSAVSRPSLWQGALRFKCLTRATINQKVLEAEYAVRGRLPTRAAAIQKELASGAKYPFTELVHCNIGNPQQVGQIPLTFNREVLALLTAPRLLEKADELVKLNLISEEAAARAREYSSKSAKVGAYTDSVGFQFIREEVCDFIARRDGNRPDISQVFLTNGASEGVRLVMSALAATHLGGRVGVMAPIPQYPLYSALSTLMDCELVGYYLDEDNRWAVSVPALTAAYEEATKRGVVVRALVVINPGNPSGNNLTAETLEKVVSFAHEKGLVLLADEVYQENVLTAHPFKSMSSIVNEKKLDLEIASFHSLSKGFLGECGVRGGYCIFENFDPEVMEQFVKLKSIELCSNTIGQLSVGLMVRPPCADAEAVYEDEKKAVLDSLRTKAEILRKTLSALPGISLQEIGGAMYAFPQVKLPKAAIEAAEAQGIAPDEFYCMQALEKTGLVVVPGSGFRQVEGTFHFRTTFLPTLDKMQRAMGSFAQFHTDFMQRYA